LLLLLYFSPSQPGTKLSFVEPKDVHFDVK